MKSSKMVRFERELERTKSKRNKEGAVNNQRKKTDLKVTEYCAKHPLRLPEGCVIHELFHDKGKDGPEWQNKIFSRGIPHDGRSVMKGILYGHVLSPHREMQRFETFTDKSNDEIYSLKDEITEILDDPFWMDIESSQKMGAYTWDGYKSLIPNIEAQYRTHGKRDISNHVVRGIQAAVDELPDDVVPISLEESIAYCKTDTNSGFPMFTSKPFIQLGEDGLSYEVLDQEAYNIYTAIAKAVWDGTAHHDLPAILFKRIQPGNGDESKKRIVECVPRGVLWSEARMWRPILEAMRTLPQYSGYNHHSLGMDRVIAEALEYTHVASLDYSSYDALVGQYLPTLFLALAKKYPDAAPMFEWCAVYYRTCPLLTPHGWIQGEHGLFSGMFGTSFGGSLLNRGLILGCVEYINNTVAADAITDYRHLAFGDDTVFAWEGNVTIHQVIDALQSFGMEMNVDKQEYCGPESEDVYIMFQACYWRHNPGKVDHCVPVYPLTRMATRLAFVEYLDKQSKLVYGAGMQLDDIECPDVVGPVIAGFISKLSQSSAHPNILDFIHRYQGTFFHYLNPLMCVQGDAVLSFVNRYFGYSEDSDAETFLSSPVCAALLLGMERLEAKERTAITKEELITASLRRKGLSKNSHGKSVEKLYETVDLADSIANSGMSEGLINSIMLRLPEEVL